MLIKDLEQFVISDSATIHDAMQAIENNWREIVMVQNQNEVIIGIITDGDIRRGLLKGLTMDSLASTVMSSGYISVALKTDRSAVLDLMKALRIRHVPVVDVDKHLLGIHFLEEIIGTNKRPNAAVIMAGGKGTRLRPYTEACPKPMVKVAGRPILERIILNLVGNGICHIFVSINYLGHMIEEHFGDGRDFGCQIEYLRETTELSTGGALSLLPDTLQDPIIVLNGDQVTRINVQALLACHTESGADATISVGHYQHEVPYGVVHQLDGHLVRLEEKPALDILINLGIYVLNPSVLQLVPKNQFFLITDLYAQLLLKNKTIATYFSEEDWIDVGRPDDLKRANGLE
ncbi:nucleotidyltransferase family protein [Solimicrobium silvestre]|uniref:Nucleotidyl transferase n=1 Tax=Solimicrobium silvestre TaxID=2099400 RepID=A0A2S9GUR4_9BURK|nr:nucleotidyltransferase family protein [Solimicrobium silvestre]PRC91475.1 Nucleotidyl transferase [Solimicrobium silvestre]